MSNIKVEVVTPVHNRKELTLGCLRSLAAVDVRGLDLHTIVVDDGSTDGTADALREQFPDVEIVSGDGNLWFTAGMNRGIESAMKHDPDYVLTINNGSEFDPQFLQSMIETATQNARSVVGAVLVNWDDKTSIFQVAPKWNVWWGGMRHWQKQTLDTIPKNPWEVELIVGNCVLFPAAVIREVGLMDEKRLPQYGDAEYTPRMRKAGWKLLIDPGAKVYCKPNDVPQRYSQMSVDSFINKVFLDPYQPQSLRRRINATVGSAPNVIQGYAAVAVFFARLLLRRNLESSWALTQNEKPLSEFYRDNVVEPETKHRSIPKEKGAVS